MSLLVTIEGIDGSGKSTLIKVIKLGLQENKVVIIDRYIDSTFVYQGLEGGIRINAMREVAKRTIDLPLPDITFVLDINPQQAQERLKIRKLATEGETPELAAKREVFEETNLVVENIEKITEENANKYSGKIKIKEVGKILDIKFMNYNSSETNEKQQPYQFYLEKIEKFKKYANGFINAKLISKIGKIVERAFKEANAFPEMYSSFLRRKLNEKYLKSNFSQTQKAKFVVGNYENDAIVVGTKASQIFNRCFYSVALTAFVLFRLTYRHRKQRLNFIQKENKRFEEIKNNIEYIKITGAEKKEIRKTKQFLKNNWRNILNLSFTKSLYASITNYVLLEFLPVFFLIFFVGNQGVGFSVALFLSLRDLFGAWKKIVEMFWAYGGYDTYCSSLRQLNNTFAILEKGEEFGKLSNQLVLSVEEARVKKIKEAAKREVFEETNLLVQDLKQTGKLQAKEKKKGSVIETKFFSEEEMSKIKLGGATKYFFEKKISILPRNKTITFQNVSFTYPGTSKKALDNFSFTFQSGKKYTIIGSNGVGKSTLFKLLVKLYRPQKGFIKLDSTDLEKFDNSALRSKIAYLPNNPSFFNASLGDNIVYPKAYRENIHKEKLEKIAKNLGVEEFVNKLPRQNLSEGQKQMVSLMRAFVRDYKIYLFDEFLSNINRKGKEALTAMKMFGKVFGGGKKSIERARDYPYYFTAKKRLNNFLSLPERDDVQKNILISNPITNITLKKVSFAYEKKKPVLKNLIMGLYQPHKAYAEHENLIENGLSTGQKQLVDLNRLFDNTAEGILKRKYSFSGELGYLDLLKLIVENGEARTDRTEGDTNIKYLVDNGVNIWNEWPFEKYKSLPDYKGETLIGFAEKIKTDSNFAKKYGNLAQFFVSKNKELTCLLYQRSGDMFLGVPFNIASYSLLTSLLAQVCGYKLGEFIHVIGDAHIYSNHLEQVKLQLERKPKKLPALKLNPKIKSLFAFCFEDINLENYEPYPPIRAKDNFDKHVFVIGGREIYQRTYLYADYYYVSIVKGNYKENGKEFSRGKKRINPPGIHGGKRKRHSAYAVQNIEKQKVY
nr:10663_t:CDS:10 [Entrophospora candida]